MRQPPTFKLCPLGMQFSSDRPIEAFQVIELTIDVPPGADDTAGAQPRIICSGVVVHCQSDSGAPTFRVWAKFLDLPADVRARIERLSQNKHLLCDHCLNFKAVGSSPAV